MPGSPPTTPNMAIPRFDDGDLASFSAQVNSVSDRVDTIAARNDSAYLLKPGDVLWSPVAARAGCLLCDGRAVSRTTYAALYAALGGSSSPWGLGDGTTTFNLPDMRGCVPMGAGTHPGLSVRSMGQFVGEEKHTLSVGELPAHAHAVTDPGHVHGVNDSGHGHLINDPGHGHTGGTTANSAISVAGRDAAVTPVGNIFTASSSAFSSPFSEVPASNAGFWEGNNLSHAHFVTVNAGFTGINVVPQTTGIGIASHTTGVSIQNTGSGTPHNNVQPSVVGNFWIKT